MKGVLKQGEKLISEDVKFRDLEGRLVECKKRTYRLEKRDARAAKDFLTTNHITSTRKSRGGMWDEELGLNMLKGLLLNIAMAFCDSSLGVGVYTSKGGYMLYIADSGAIVSPNYDAWLIPALLGEELRASKREHQTTVSSLKKILMEGKVDGIYGDKDSVCAIKLYGGRKKK